jgi:hypothetical protein
MTSENILPIPGHDNKAPSTLDFALEYAARGWASFP